MTFKELKVKESWLNKGAGTWNKGDQPDSGGDALVSPWYQYNIFEAIGKEDSKSEGDEDGTFAARLDGYHQHRILYFKQLDN